MQNHPGEEVHTGDIRGEQREDICRKERLQRANVEVRGEQPEDAEDDAAVQKATHSESSVSEIAQNVAQDLPGTFALSHRGPAQQVDGKEEEQQVRAEPGDEEGRVERRIRSEDLFADDLLAGALVDGGRADERCAVAAGEDDRWWSLRVTRSARSALKEVALKGLHFVERAEIEELDGVRCSDPGYGHQDGHKDAKVHFEGPGGAAGLSATGPSGSGTRWFDAMNGRQVGDHRRSFCWGWSIRSSSSS